MKLELPIELDLTFWRVIRRPNSKAIFKFKWNKKVKIQSATVYCLFDNLNTGVSSSFPYFLPLQTRCLLRSCPICFSFCCQINNQGGRTNLKCLLHCCMFLFPSVSRVSATRFVSYAADLNSLSFFYFKQSVSCSPSLVGSIMPTGYFEFNGILISHIKDNIAKSLSQKS